MQARVASGNDAPAASRIASLPSGDHAAGALDDGDKRNDVVWVEPSLDHEIDLAEREHAVVVAVATVALEAHGLTQGLEALRIVADEVLWRRCSEQRLAERSARSDAHRPCRPVVLE